MPDAEDGTRLRDRLERAARLEAMGVTVRSAELLIEAERIRSFWERGGNRAMRRAAERAARKKGR